MTPSAAALWRPPGAVGGGWRPTASCAHCVRLQAVTVMSPYGRMTPPAAALWRPPGAVGGGWHPTASCAHYVRLQAVTDMSPFGRMTPPAAALWRPEDAVGGGWRPTASCRLYWLTVKFLPSPTSIKNFLIDIFLFNSATVNRFQKWSCLVILARVL